MDLVCLCWFELYEITFFPHISNSNSNSKHLKINKYEYAIVAVIWPVFLISSFAVWLFQNEFVWSRNIQ